MAERRSSRKAHKAPGKSYRRGISLIELQEMFPDEAAARKWFETILWGEGQRYCPRCGTDNNYKCKHAKMPYRCRDCKKYFSVRTGTVLERSKIPLRKWAICIYLELTSLKGVSSMKIHRDLGVTQQTAWFMLHRIREAFMQQGPRVQFLGPVEVDETFVGGRVSNMHKSAKERLDGRSNKMVVVGVKDRASKQVRALVSKSRKAEDVLPIVRGNVAPGAMVFTDEASTYRMLESYGYRHGTVQHKAGEYVEDRVHTNSIESFWSMLKRGHKGVYHKFSPKHLQRYVDQYAGRHNMRELDTIDQMSLVVEGMAGKRLTYKKLIEPNGLPSLARPPADEVAS